MSCSNSQTRIRFILLLLLVGVGLLLSGCGDSPAQVYRVGILVGGDTYAGIAEGFKARMAELGYVEGRNIVYEQQSSYGYPAQEQPILDKFVADKVDLIFAFSGAGIDPNTAALKTDIPIVFVLAGPEGPNLFGNDGQRYGNITGVRFPGPEMTAKRLQFLLTLAPGAKRVYITYNRDLPANQNALTALRPLASSLNVVLVEAPVTRVEEIRADLNARAKAAEIGLDVILMMPDDFSQSSAGWQTISQFAAEHGVPVGGYAVDQVEQGAVFSYIPDNVKTGRLAAAQADRIFKGARPGDIPIITAEASLRLNTGLAQELKLTVPEGLVKQAIAVIP